MKSASLLSKLTEATGISGREDRVAKIILNFFTHEEGREWISQVHRDKLGNIILHKKGQSEAPPKIMFAAHMDEIGLIVTDIEEGFLRFSSIGGIDQRVLVGQEVIVHGKKDLLGIIGAKPPHIQTPDERGKSIKIQDMTIDLGLSQEKTESLVKIGDSITNLD